ncbi:MAG TPA: class I SAM-dependent methyltransferase [Gemmatimonadaceae bacterium]|nr:class I SAM-dependent methyltransferase [Gemmatimonadaceae bacterium]
MTGGSHEGESGASGPAGSENDTSRRESGGNSGSNSGSNFGSNTGSNIGSGINRESYDAIARQWDAARTSFHGSERRYLDALLEGLTAPAHILDLGCGTGRPMAEYVLARGHQVTGVDQSEELLTLARTRFPEGEWIRSRVEDFLGAVDGTGIYDGAITWDSLFHIERDRHEGILSDVHRALVPGGRLMLTAGGSAHPAFTDTMFDREFFYDSHPPERLVGLLRELGFEIVVNEFMNLPTSGRDKGRIAIVVQKHRSRTTQ